MIRITERRARASLMTSSFQAQLVKDEKEVEMQAGYVATPREIERKRATEGAPDLRQETPRLWGNTGRRIETNGRLVHEGE
jgi:hypothetical protein